MEDWPSLIWPLAALAGLMIVMGLTGPWELALLGAAVAIGMLVIAVQVARRRAGFLWAMGATTAAGERGVSRRFSVGSGRASPDTVTFEARPAEIGPSVADVAVEWNIARAGTARRPPPHV